MLTEERLRGMAALHAICQLLWLIRWKVLNVAWKCTCLCTGYWQDFATEFSTLFLFSFFFSIRFFFVRLHFQLRAFWSSASASFFFLSCCRFYRIFLVAHSSFCRHSFTCNRRRLSIHLLHRSIILHSHSCVHIRLQVRSFWFLLLASLNFFFIYLRLFQLWSFSLWPETLHPNISPLQLIAHYHRVWIGLWIAAQWVGNDRVPKCCGGLKFREQISTLSCWHSHWRHSHIIGY